LNTYWIVAAIAAVIVFAVGEWYAFSRPHRQNTLSRAIWSLGQKWPLSIFIMGMFVGALVVHLFWPWCPALMPPGTGG